MQLLSSAPCSKSHHTCACFAAIARPKQGAAACRNGDVPNLYSFSRTLSLSVIFRDFCQVQDKLVAAVCHGPGALTEAELNGKPLVKGKKVMLRNSGCHTMSLSIVQSLTA